MKSEEALALADMYVKGLRRIGARDALTLATLVTRNYSSVNLLAPQNVPFSRGRPAAPRGAGIQRGGHKQ